MRIPLAWLRDYVELPPDVDAIVAKLATLGFPVESIERRPPITNVVIGTIVILEKHPNADKLQVCTLDVGAASPLIIATAATNVAAGNVVPVALVGAQLPKLRIEPRKMRGIDSQGMLCSADELGLPPEWFDDGIMQFDSAAPNGTDVVALFGLDLPVLDVEIGANRGDALCVVGIARELAAGFNVRFEFPATAGGDRSGDAQRGSDSSDVAVTLRSGDVRRYVAQRVSGVRSGAGPTAMRVRLALAGQRPISNLVDISNFVMLELGQPLHFFDFEKIGGRQIIVRDALPGEQLTTLDGVSRALDPTALVIADAGQATGLAGLMGGLVSEVSATTREIVIESANFFPARIRRMSVKLGLRTEASTRNEKNLALALTDIGAARAAHLLAADGALVQAPRAFGQPVAAPLVIELDQREVQRLLGFAVAPDELQHALEVLGFSVQQLPELKSRFAVSVPRWRTDISIAADLVEEIARIIGYDRVRAELPPIAPQTLDSAAFDREMMVAETLVGLGYSECITLGLQPHSVAERWLSFGLDIPPSVEIRNPLSEDQRWLRFSMLPALLEHAARERAQRPLYTFEIGHVFSDAEQPREVNVVTMLATTKGLAQQPAWRDTAFLTASSDVRALVRALTGQNARLERGTAAGLHPGKTAQVFAGKTAIGHIGTVDPRLLRAEGITDDAVAAVLFLDALPPRVITRYVPGSKFPPLERDVAIIVEPDVSAADIVATIRGATALSREIDVFDEYRGPQIGAGKKSLAVRIALQRDDATLTDSEAQTALRSIVDALSTAHGAMLRE